MSRLTEKVKNTDDYIKLATKDKQEFINKLGKLEDLEEEIGVNNLIAFEDILKQSENLEELCDGFYNDILGDGIFNFDGLYIYNDFDSFVYIFITILIVLKMMGLL